LSEADAFANLPDPGKVVSRKGMRPVVATKGVVETVSLFSFLRKGFCYVSN
jgi:hypothetical protein